MVTTSPVSGVPRPALAALAEAYPFKPYRQYRAYSRREQQAILLAEIDAWCRERFGNLTFDFDVLSGAEVGCWLSHLTAWDLLRGRPRETACTVLEDDVLVAPGFAAAIADLERTSTFDVVYLGTSSRNVSERRRTRSR